MLKNYAKELAAVAIAFGLISYTVYVCAAEPVKAKAVTAAKPADKKATKPVKEVKPTAPAKKEHAKKPTLKAKFKAAETK
jgi:hypothetical protein